MSSSTSQNLEAYVPVYDMVPEKWEDARQFLVEHLKKISNAVNVREIGWYLEEELLSGKQYTPAGGLTGQSVQYRSIFRKIIDCSPLVAGPNQFAHGINFDANFTLIQLFGAATDSIGFTAIPLPNNIDSLTMDATFVNINVAAGYDRCTVVIEYILEV
jgi:hypothetical protein